MFERRHPGRPAPRLFDEEDVARVARCAAAIEGDALIKRQAMLDAITGALRVSRRPPTARFIWGTRAHFQDHVERGRRQREEQQLAARASRAPAEAEVAPPVTPSERLTADRMSADLERVLGPKWRDRV